MSQQHNYSVIDMEGNYAYTVLNISTKQILADRLPYEEAKAIFEVNNVKDAWGCNSLAWIIKSI